MSEQSDWKTKDAATTLRLLIGQVRSDLAGAHAEICKLQGLDPVAHSWPEWSPQANTLRWLDQIEGDLASAPPHQTSSWEGGEALLAAYERAKATLGFTGTREAETSYAVAKKALLDALSPPQHQGLAALREAGEVIARPLADWHEDDGNVVWWTFPVASPGWIGAPNDGDWPGYHTHWTPGPPVPTRALSQGEGE